MVQFHFKITLLLYLNYKWYPWLSMARNYSLFCQVNVLRCQKKTLNRSRFIFFLIESVDNFFSRIPRMTKDVWEYLVVISAQI